MIIIQVSLLWHSNVFLVPRSQVPCVPKPRLDNAYIDDTLLSTEDSKFDRWTICLCQHARCYVAEGSYTMKGLQWRCVCMVRCDTLCFCQLVDRTGFIWRRWTLIMCVDSSLATNIAPYIQVELVYNVWDEAAYGDITSYINRSIECAQLNVHIINAITTWHALVVDNQNTLGHQNSDNCCWAHLNKNQLQPDVWVIDFPKLYIRH